MRILSTTVGLALSATAAFADVNVYSYRQPELIAPLMAAFTEKTGIEVNTIFLEKGLFERLKAEGSRSPADLVFTVDISRLAALADAGLTQTVESPVLAANIRTDGPPPSVPFFRNDDEAHLVTRLGGRSPLDH